MSVWGRRRSGCRVAPSVPIELCPLYLTGKMSHTEIDRRLGGLNVSALSQNSKRLEAKMPDEFPRSLIGIFVDPIQRQFHNRRILFHPYSSALLGFDGPPLFLTLPLRMTPTPSGVDQFQCL